MSTSRPGLPTPIAHPAIPPGARHDENRLASGSTSLATTTGKDALIRNVLGMNLVWQTITERSVLVEGDISLVFGTAELRFAAAGKEDWSSTLRYTSTHVKRDGQWRMLALQMQRRAPD